MRDHANKQIIKKLQSQDSFNENNNKPKLKAYQLATNAKNIEVREYRKLRKNCFRRTLRQYGPKTDEYADYDEGETPAALHEDSNWPALN